MTQENAIRIYRTNNEAYAARRRARRRKDLVNTVLEALATIGLGTCFILCAVLFLCAI